MRIELGQFGVWKRASESNPDLVMEVERLGYGAFWAGGSPGGALHDIERLLDATESMPIATGIINMWRDDAETVAASYHRISDRYPDRFLLGVGIGHPESTSEYRKPMDVVRSYLDRLGEAGVPKDHIILAALGPSALRESTQRAAGSHPYLTTPRHTRMARELIGESALLAPEQTVVVTGDPDEARDLARDFVARYLRLVNYRNNLLREGWDASDLADGGSDRLVSELVLTGPVDQVAAGVRAHLDAGADHVTIQDLGPDPTAAYRTLAAALFPANLR